MANHRTTNAKETLDAIKTDAAAKPALLSTRGYDKSFDFNEWDKQKTGYAPYWKPAEEGDWFVGTIISKDVGQGEDGDFVRYMFKSEMRELQGYNGPANDAEKISIAFGDYFTISAWFALTDELDYYLQQDFQVTLALRALKKVRTQARRDVWKFDLRTPPEVTRKLDKNRTAYLLARRQQQEVQVMNASANGSSKRIPDATDSAF